MFLSSLDQFFIILCDLGVVPVRAPYFLWACHVGLSSRHFPTLVERKWPFIEILRFFFSGVLAWVNWYQWVDGFQIPTDVGQRWWRYHNLCVHFNKHRLCKHLFCTRSLMQSFSGFVTKSSPKKWRGAWPGDKIRYCIVVHRNWEKLIAFLVNVIYMKIICSPPVPSKENLGVLRVGTGTYPGCEL